MHACRSTLEDPTGWRAGVDGRFHESLEQHDDGEKTILGHTGRWHGDELIGFLLEHRATPLRLARRLCELFLNDAACTPERIESLAAELRAHELDLGHGVALVLRSRAFFAAENLGGAVLAPATFVIGAARALEFFDPPPSSLLCAEWCTRMGQDLFYPPTVFGWDGGRAWITTGTLLARARFASELASGALCPQGMKPAESLARRHACTAPAEFTTLLQRLFLGDAPARAEVRDPSEPPAQPALLLARFLSSPAAQLG